MQRLSAIEVAALISRPDQQMRWSSRWRGPRGVHAKERVGLLPAEASIAVVPEAEPWESALSRHLLWDLKAGARLHAHL